MTDDTDSPDVDVNAAGAAAPEGQPPPPDAGWLRLLAGAMLWRLAASAVLAVPSILGVISLLSYAWPPAAALSVDLTLRGADGAVALGPLAFWLAYYLLPWWATWRLTVPEPGRVEHPPWTLRRVLRVLVTAGTAYGLALQVLAATVSASDDPLEGDDGPSLTFAALALVHGVVLVVASLGVYVYWQRLARRLGDGDLASHTVLFTWGTAVIFALWRVFPLVMDLASAVAGTPPPPPGPGLLASVVMAGFAVWMVYLVIRYRSLFLRSAAAAERAGGPA